MPPPPGPGSGQVSDSWTALDADSVGAMRARPTMERQRAEVNAGEDARPLWQRQTALALAAFLALSLRSSLLSLAALALPPFSPPSRPRATASGFFPSVFSDRSMSCLSVSWAI